jgi:hypothetical protein
MYNIRVYTGRQAAEYGKCGKRALKFHKAAVVPMLLHGSETGLRRNMNSSKLKHKNDSRKNQLSGKEAD